MVKLAKFCSESLHRHTDRCVVFKFGEIWPREIGEILHCLPDKTKFHLALKLSLLHRSHPKFAWAIPDNVLRVLQISSKSVHFSLSYGRKVNPVFG